MDKTKKTKKRKKINYKRQRRLIEKKLTVVWIIMVLAFILLIIPILNLTVVKRKEYTQRVLNARKISDKNIPYKRGEIRDRNGIVIARSVKIFDVIFDPKAIEETHLGRPKAQKKAGIETAKMLNKYFGISEEEVKKIIKERPNSRYELLKRGVSHENKRLFIKEQQARIKNNKLNACGISFHENYKRDYPYDESACEVIGLLNGDGNPMYGIEKSYNKFLSGKNGRKYYYVEKNSKLMSGVSEPENGNDIVTTIDMNLQKMIEDRLIEFNKKYEKYDADGKKIENGSLHTAVLVMDPNTGEVLAQANYPSYNLNKPNEKKYYEGITRKMKSEADKIEFVRKNFCISDVFEPGSTTKPFTEAAGYMTNTLDKNTKFFCDGHKQVADKKIACHKRDGHGYVDADEGLAYSCNVAMMDIVANMEMKDFIRYQKIFGLGKPTGIDLPNEASGRLIPEETMNVVDLATNSFGQNFEATMIQVASGFSSIVNGGNYYQPRIVKNISDSNKFVVKNTSPKLKRKTVSKEVSDKIKEGLAGVVSYGTGRNLGVKGYDIAGKTGTAEKIPRKDGRYLLSFIGCAPIDKPEVVYYVVIDEINQKKQDDHGAIVDLSKKVAADIFPYLHITGNGDEIEEVKPPVLDKEEEENKR